MIAWAKELQLMGFDVPPRCQECIEQYGTPCCDDRDEGGSECGGVDALGELLIDAGLYDNYCAVEDGELYE
jgi:hypothetical protein